MAFCLPPAIADRFMGAIRDGTLDPNALADLSSADRRAALSKYVGEENAADVNAALESKILLNDQQRGFVTWAKQTAGLTEPARRDLISRIERMDKLLNPAEEKSFLSDLAAQKIGATVTMDEAKAISDGAKKISDLKAAIPEGAEDGSKERLAYGLAARQYHNYMNHLLGREAPSLGKLLTTPIAFLKAQPGIQKGINAAFDLSYAFRQGYKMLATNPDIWARDTVKMFKDAGKELTKSGSDLAPMDLVHADIMSRTNALNGKYKAMDVNLALDFEEAFPESPVDKVPGLGRIYKASETAFNGTALRMRADLADRMIEKAEAFGLDMTNSAQAAPIGDLVNDMTGRGKIPGLSQGASNFVNLAFFSARFLKSNWDTLTGQTGGFFIKDAAARRFVRIESAKNLAKLVAFAGGIMAVSNFLHPGSAELNPLSSNFGKLKFGQTTFDISGGMAPIITLASRVLLRETKSSTTGEIKELNSGQFGARTALDYVNDFFEGRASPFGQALLNYLRGENFQGQKPTILNTLGGLYTPMPFQTAMQAPNEPNTTVAFGAMLADFLGVSSNAPNPLGIGLGARDPAELEMVRLGFTPKNFQIATGNSKADELIEEQFQPIVAKNIAGLINSPGYARMTDAYRALVLKSVIDGTKKMATVKAMGEDPKLFLRLKIEGKFNQQQRGVFQEQTGQTPEDMLAP